MNGSVSAARLEDSASPHPVYFMIMIGDLRDQQGVGAIDVHNFIGIWYKVNGKDLEITDRENAVGYLTVRSDQLQRRIDELRLELEKRSTT